MEFLKELLIITVSEIVCLIGAIVIAGFILGFFRERSIENFYKAFGKKSIYITGFIGVPIHELSHAIAALIFRHKITEIKLFKPSSEDNTLGYVKHKYNPRSIYQQIGNFFIGIAPILGGILSISVLMYFLVPSIYKGFMSNIIDSININQINLINVISSFKELIKLIFTLNNLKDIKFIIFMFLAICISSHISLSKADIKGASKGLFSMFLMLIILNLLGIRKYISINMIISYNMLMINILFISIIFSLITYVISLIIKSILK